MGGSQGGGRVGPAPLSRVAPIIVGSQGYVPGILGRAAGRQALRSSITGLESIHHGDPICRHRS